MNFHLRINFVSPHHFAILKSSFEILSRPMTPLKVLNFELSSLLRFPFQLGFAIARARGPPPEPLPWILHRVITNASIFYRRRRSKPTERLDFTGTNGNWDHYEIATTPPSFVLSCLMDFSVKLLPVHERALALPLLFFTFQKILLFMTLRLFEFFTIVLFSCISRCSNFQDIPLVFTPPSQLLFFKLPSNAILLRCSVIHSAANYYFQRFFFSKPKIEWKLFLLHFTCLPWSKKLFMFLKLIFILFNK